MWVASGGVACRFAPDAVLQAAPAAQGRETAGPGDRPRSTVPSVAASVLRTTAREWGLCPPPARPSRPHLPPGACCTTPPPRLLIVPGLHDSEPAHWQSRLQAQHPQALRVVQDDFACPDLPAWAAQIDRTLRDAGPGPWWVVAHSFGCLATVRYLADHPDHPVREALLVAPAEPAKFGLEAVLPQAPLPLPLTLWASENDPWMSLDSALAWGQRWGARVRNLGAVGHINPASGFGPLPAANQWVTAARQRWARERRSA